MNANVKAPTMEELLAQVEMLKTALAAKSAAATGVVSFAQSEKNPKFFTFKHGSKEAWPVSTTPAVWRVILANAKMIEAKLPKA